MLAQSLSNCVSTVLHASLQSEQFINLGLTREDRVAVVMPNGPEAAVAFLGMSLYCTYAPLNPGLKPSEFEFEYEDMPAKALVIMEGSSGAVAANVAKRRGLPIIDLVPRYGRRAARRQRFSPPTQNPTK